MIAPTAEDVMGVFTSVGRAIGEGTTGCTSAGTVFAVDEIVLTPFAVPASPCVDNEAFIVVLVVVGDDDAVEARFSECTVVGDLEGDVASAIELSSFAFDCVVV